MRVNLKKYDVANALRLMVSLLYVCATLTLNAQNQSFCGTVGGGPGSIGPIPPNFQGNNPPSGPFYIRVYPHVIRMPDGSGGQTDEAIDAAFARLAADFNPHNIFFVRACDVIDVNVSEGDYFDFNIWCDLWGNQLFQHNDGIDMFFCSEDVTNNAGGIAADIPSKTLWVGGTWPIGQGAPWNAAVSPIISHEMGHCLGLWHTFHGTIPEIGIDCQGGTTVDPNACCELVNGSNSASCGDYVTDTDADPLRWFQFFTNNPPCAGGLGWLQINDFLNCMTQDPNTFERFDFNGQLYTPLLDNTMSYNQSLLCLTGFTDGQGERMRQVIAISPILQACLVQPDMVDVIINTNTTWTTANTPNNGDFLIEGNLTIMGGATLTINSGVRIRFGENSKLVVRPNARVRLSGTLTSMGCSQTWIGVEVQGSAAIPPQSQYVVNGVRAQGRLEGLTGSVIENAQTAAKLYGPTAAFAGGQISCNGTTFRNNILGVDFANYLNFWPFAGSQLGQPRNYFGSISRCVFVTDDDYPHTAPFNSFIYMSGVNGINIAGTGFANQRDIEGNSIDDWGYGIQSVDAGFTVTSSANGIVFPPTSYTFSGFSGLGYAIQAQTSTVNRPYVVRQTNFDLNFVGIRNWSVDGVTILFNNFNLADLPSTEPTSDAVGIIFETDVSGFTCEENEFLKTGGGDNIEAIGTISINTGDQHKQIRRNTYTGLNIGNLANQQNAYIDDPNDPSDDGTFQGLYYDCNRNFNTEGIIGIDFSVPDGIIRPRQGLETTLPNGTIGYRAAGNRFSYTAIDFSNFGAAINYYYDPLSANHQPLTTQGNVSILMAKDNTCTQSFCEPPCRNDEELVGIKSDYYVKKNSLAALDASMGTNPTEQQKATRSYYQCNMDQAAYMVALHIMYDTVHYNHDSLRTWVANMNSIEGDLWLANDYLSTGAVAQANAILDAMSAKHHLDFQKQADIADVKAIANAIAGQDASNLNETALQIIKPIALGTDGFARGWARRLLTQHGWHFAPEYVKYGEGSQERSQGNTDRFDSDNLKIQPNPASDHVLFTMPDHAEDATLRIFDLNGKTIRSYTDMEGGSIVNWQTGDAPSGIYLYHFTSKGKIHSGKILLNK
jgi:hypothetical protein